MSGAKYINPKWSTGIFLPDWLLEMNLSHATMLCYGRLARLAQKRGHAFPSREYLANELKVSEAQVSTYIKALTDAGLIEVRRTGRSNQYLFPIHPNMELSENEINKQAKRYKETFEQELTDQENQKSISRVNLKADIKKTLSPYNERSYRENINKNGTPKKQNSIVVDYPADFKVGANIRKLAIENKWPDPDSELAAFKDHHLARGSKFKDWEAAFRTWLRNAKKWSKPKSKIDIYDGTKFIG